MDARELRKILLFGPHSIGHASRLTRREMPQTELGAGGSKKQSSERQGALRISSYLRCSEIESERMTAVWNQRFSSGLFVRAGAATAAGARRTAARGTAAAVATDARAGGAKGRGAVNAKVRVYPLFKAL